MSEASIFVLRSSFCVKKFWTPEVVKNGVYRETKEILVRVESSMMKKKHKCWIIDVVGRGILVKLFGLSLLSKEKDGVERWRVVVRRNRGLCGKSNNFKIGKWIAIVSQRWNDLWNDYRNEYHKIDIESMIFISERIDLKFEWKYRRQISFL